MLAPTIAQVGTTPALAAHRRGVGWNKEDQLRGEGVQAVCRADSGSSSKHLMPFRRNASLLSSRQQNLSSQEDFPGLPTPPPVPLGLPATLQFAPHSSARKPTRILQGAPLPAGKSLPHSGFFHSRFLPTHPPPELSTPASCHMTPRTAQPTFLVSPSALLLASAKPGPT